MEKSYKFVRSLFIDFVTETREKKSNRPEIKTKNGTKTGFWCLQHCHLFRLSNKKIVKEVSDQFPEMNTFRSAEAKENSLRFSAECNQRNSDLLMGFSDIDSMIQASEENLRNSKKCSKCGLFVNDYYKLDMHIGSENCKQRQAKLKGETYVSKRQRKKLCEICNRSVLTYNWNGHLLSVKHKENVRRMNEPAFQCTVCDKIFKGARPKQMLKKHLTTCQKHLKKLDEPWNKFKHNKIIRKHFKKCKVI